MGNQCTTPLGLRFADQFRRITLRDLKVSRKVLVFVSPEWPAKHCEATTNFPNISTRKLVLAKVLENVAGRTLICCEAIVVSISVYA